MYPMARFDNPVGHPIYSKSDCTTTMLCLTPSPFGEPSLMASALFGSLVGRLSEGLLWCVPGLDKISGQGVMEWHNGTTGESLGSAESSFMERLTTGLRPSYSTLRIYPMLYG